ncbi:MAG: hypothetical protein IJ942_03765 [Alistipes sp.]|nr:hypothetical protein [Alistipes sp.]
MKRFFRLMLLCATMFVSCSPIEVPNAGNNQTKELVYTVNVNIGLSEMASKYGATATLNVVFMEYNDKNERINIQNWYNVKDNATKRLTAHKLATKMVVYIEVTATANGKTAKQDYFIAQVYYLENNMQIKIDGTCRISEYNPI